jgi:hypothetical protein
MPRIFGLIILNVCLLGASMAFAQEQRFLTGIYLQGGPGTYRPFRSIHFCYEAGGAGSYPITKRITWDVNLGYSRSGLSQNEYTRIAGTNNYVVQRITRHSHIRLEFGIGIPDRKRVRWGFGGFVGALLFANEVELQLSGRGPISEKYSVTDQFRRYDYGLQIAMHGTLSEHLQINLKLRQGLPNLRPGWTDVSTRSQAALVGFSYFPSFGSQEK